MTVSHSCMAGADWNERCLGVEEYSRTAAQVWVEGNETCSLCGDRGYVCKENNILAGIWGSCSYTEVANNVQKEETVTNIQFVLLDCSHLKFSLVQHCNEWQNKFATLLREMAAGRLLELHTYLKENAEKCGLGRPTGRGQGQALGLSLTSTPFARLQNQPPSADAGGTGGQLAARGCPEARLGQRGDSDPSHTRAICHP